MVQETHDTLREAVRTRYSKVATTSSCCSGSTEKRAKVESVEMGYAEHDVEQVPEGANMGLGCGNPRAIASLTNGDVVLDLGSGGGFDCFLAAREVGDEGLVIGVDMTPEMVSKARKNSIKAGFNNVDFRLGEIEYLPVADGVVDVIISNCVINLSPEKARVFQEAFRVLKPGGRLAISDVVATAELPESITADIKLYTCCAAGASPVTELEAILTAAGFEGIRIKPNSESKEFIQNWVPGSHIEDYIVSATIEAVKPKTCLPS